MRVRVRRTLWACALLGLAPACGGGEPPAPEPAAEAPDPAPAAASVQAVDPASDPTLGDPSQTADAPRDAVAGGAALAVGATVELSAPCYGSTRVPEGEIASPQAQQKIRAAIRESWSTAGGPHPHFAVAPTRSKVTLVARAAAHVIVEPASGPWAGQRLHLPASCLAQGRVFPGAPSGQPGAPSTPVPRP